MKRRNYSKYNVTKSAACASYNQNIVTVTNRMKFHSITGQNEEKKLFKIQPLPL